MPFSLGVHQSQEHFALARRLAWLTAARLLVLTAALLLIFVFYVRVQISLESFTTEVVLATVGAAFGLTIVYAFALRTGRRLRLLAHVQLVFDQLIWTVIVYLTGGASSGATSFYGLSCIAGAILIGVRGAATAAVAAGLAYTTVSLCLDGGWLMLPPDQPPSLYRLTSSELWFHVLVNWLVLVVVTLLVSYLAERLRTTGGQLVRARERAEQAERLAALGRLAAGLAHEIRNPLSSISGSVQLLKSGKSLSLEDKQLCEIVVREAARLNDLVADMMDLSRPREPLIRIVDAVGVAREVVELSSKSGRAVTDVDVVFSGPKQALVRADGAQLRQLIWNLVRNAVQASSAGDRVTVEISVTSDDRVVLCVADKGIGIDEAAREQLFDAFFTTRSKGTGVGLAVVKRIADQHGFSIDVQSGSGAGARFSVDLGVPASHRSSAPAPEPV